MPEQDREAAVELLESDFSGEIPQSGTEPAETCPSCGSDELAIEKGSRKTAALMTMTYFVPVWFWRSRLRCRNCGWSRRLPIRFRPELAVVLLGFAVAALVAPLAAVLALALVFQFLKKFSEFY